MYTHKLQSLSLICCTLCILPSLYQKSVCLFYMCLCHFVLPLLCCSQSAQHLDRLCLSVRLPAIACAARSDTCVTVEPNSVGICLINATDLKSFQREREKEEGGGSWQI